MSECLNYSRKWLCLGNKYFLTSTSTSTSTWFASTSTSTSTRKIVLKYRSSTSNSTQYNKTVKKTKEATDVDHTLVPSTRQNSYIDQWRRRKESRCHSGNAADSLRRSSRLDTLQCIDMDWNVTHNSRQTRLSVVTNCYIFSISIMYVFRPMMGPTFSLFSSICINLFLPSSSIWPHLSYGLVRSKREYYHNCSLVVFLCSFL